MNNVKIRLELTAVKTCLNMLPAFIPGSIFKYCNKSHILGVAQIWNNKNHDEPGRSPAMEMSSRFRK